MQRPENVVAQVEGLQGLRAFEGVEVKGGDEVVALVEKFGNFIFFVTF